MLACYTTLWEDWRFLLPTSKHAECVILPCCCPKDGSGHCTTKYVCKAKVFGNNVSVIVWEKYVEVKSCKVYEAFRGDLYKLVFAWWSHAVQLLSPGSSSCQPFSFVSMGVVLNPDYQLSCHLSLACLLQRVQPTTIWRVVYLFLTMWKLSW